MWNHKVSMGMVFCWEGPRDSRVSVLNPACVKPLIGWHLLVCAPAYNLACKAEGDASTIRLTSKIKLKVMEG